MDLKKEAALSAITFIRDKSRIGLGAGATMVHLVELLAKERQADLDISVVTSSFSTRQALLKNGFVVQPVTDIYELDIYLDGCDQFDRDLNALKSGGGIHTLEKLLAYMAKQFLLVGDETKYSDQFNDKYPLVIEVLPEAYSFVQHSIQKLFPQVRIEMRASNKKDGAVITEHGNYLLDCWFSSWPQLGELNINLKTITGVVETSLFYQLAHKAVLAGSNGIKIFERSLK